MPDTIVYMGPEDKTAPRSPNHLPLPAIKRVFNAPCHNFRVLPLPA